MRRLRHKLRILNIIVNLLCLLTNIVNLQNLFIQASAFTEDFDVEEEDYVETLRQKLKTLRS